MYNFVKIQAIFNATVWLGLYPEFSSFIYNEDVKDVHNIHEKYWEMKQHNLMKINEPKDRIVVGFPFEYAADNMYQFSLLQAACEAIGLQYKTVWKNYSKVEKLFLKKEIDVFLLSFGAENFEMFLNPFVPTEYAIFYKAGTFHASSTYFMDGLSTELWIYTWSAVVLMFIGFLISAKVYEKYFKVHSTIVDVAFYQMNFISNQIVESPYQRFKSWRLQTMCGWFLNIIMMTAVFTLIVALLSVKRTSVPFKTLDDFVRLRTHTICLQPGIIPQKYFHDEFNILLEKYRGIYNEPKCKIINKNIHKICDYDDIAVVWPVHQMPEYLIKCRLLKLSGIFSKSYGSVMIQNGFKYREQFNRMYVHLQSTGIVQRANKRYRTTILKKNYKAKEDYQVELEGVLFEHVQLIFLVYSFIFPLVSIVMIIEKLFHWRAMRKTARIEPIEQRLEAFDGVDDTEVNFNEVLEVIDLE